MEEYPFTLQGSGPVTSERKHTHEGGGSKVFTDARANVAIEFSIEELISEINGEKNAWTHTPRNRVEKLVKEELSENNCSCSADQWEQWDVTLDGDVRAWLTLYEKYCHRRSNTKLIESLVEEDEIGEGLELALREKERRGE